MNATLIADPPGAGYDDSVLTFTTYAEDLHHFSGASPSDRVLAPITRPISDSLKISRVPGAQPSNRAVSL
jgi:hypothetical protein